MRELWQKSKYPVCLFVLSIIGYVWALYYAPIYDFADEFFPGRYFMSEAIWNKIFPVWLPYRSLGQPMHADPQAGAFYLPLWIFSFFTRYQPVMWGVEHIFHAFMGGLGFYFMSKRLIKNEASAFIVAICYMLSGFFVANMQHISWIIAGAWMPWVIKSLFDIFENPSLKHALVLALFASLLFTGAYTGFVFLAFLFFVILFLYYFIIKLRRKDFAYFKSGFLYLFISLIVTLLLVLPSFYSFLEIKDLITRGTALTYEDTTTVVFTPQSLLSLFFPLISCTEGGFTGTDISMGNIYIGGFFLFFSVVGLFQKKPGYLKVFLYWGLVCFLLSFGYYLPFHKWAFYTIPFINMLRITAIFRLFTIMSLLLLAVLGIDKVLKDFVSYRKPLLIYSFSLAGVMLLVTTVFLLQQPEITRSLFTFDLREMMYGSIRHKFVFEAVSLMILLLLLAFVVWKKRKYMLILFIGLITVDMVFNAWICERRVGMMTEYTNKQFKELLNTQPDAFPVPREVTSSPRIYRERDFYPFWRNLGIFSKQIEWNSCSSLALKSQKRMIVPFDQQGIELYLETTVFFPDAVVCVSEPIVFSSDTAYTFELEDCYIPTQGKEQAEVEIELFYPGSIILKTYCQEKRPLVICQNFYPGWKAKTDSGMKLEPYTLNSTLLSVDVPAGEQRIHIYYSKKILKYGFLLQGLTFAAVLFFLFIIFLKERKRTKLHY